MTRRKIVFASLSSFVLQLGALALYGQAGNQVAVQPLTTGGVQRPAHTQRVMAPPLETRAAVKLRPSTAEGGMTHGAKPPLRALPALTAVSADNKVHNTAALSHAGHWLLVYRTDHCVACDRLMNALAASSSADFRSGVPYTIIVGSKSPSALAEVRANYSTLGGAAWLADRDQSVYTKLQLKGVPEVIAMDGDRVAWKISGNLGDPKQVLRLTDSWIAGTAAADEAAKPKSATLVSPASGSGPAATMKR